MYASSATHDEKVLRAVEGERAAEAERLAQERLQIELATVNHDLVLRAMRLALSAPEREAAQAEALLEAVTAYLRVAQQRGSSEPARIAAALAELRQACASRDGEPAQQRDRMTDDPRAIIAEDEAMLGAGLRDALAALWPNLRICALVEDGIQTLRALEEHKPDILFLDIQMPGLSGLEVAQQVNGRCHVVFVTAFDDHAIQAFEQGAVDYLLKPLSVSRLATAVARLKQRIGSTPARLDGLIDRLAETARRRISPLDHGVARPRGPADHDRGSLLLPLRQQVHRRRHARRRGIDPSDLA